MKRLLCLLTALLLCAGCSNRDLPVEENSSGTGEPQTETILGNYRYPYIDMEQGLEYMGYIDEHGNIAIPAQRIIAYEFVDQLALVCTFDNRYYYINMDGENPFGETYDRATSFVGGVAMVKTGDLWTAIDTEGNPTQRHENHMYSVSQNKETNLYEATTVDSQVIFTTEYFPMGSFVNGLLPVMLDDMRLAYLDTEGNMALETEYYCDVLMGYNQYIYSHSFTDGLAIVSTRDHLFGFIDETGATVIEPVYLAVSPFSEGLAMAATEDGVGYINKQGEMVIEPQFDGGRMFSEGVAAVIKRGESTHEDRLGFIDTQGNLVVDYLYIEDYSANSAWEASNRKQNGLIQVRSAEGWRGYIDDQGNVIFRSPSEEDD